MQINKETKICFFNSTRSWGGGEKWHFEMASRLEELGYNVLFITTATSVLARKLANTNISTEYFPVTNLSFLNPFKLLRLKRLFVDEGVSVILMNLSADVKTAGIAARWARVKRIIYRRGSAIPVKNSMLNRWLFSHVITDVLANSEATRKTLLQNNKKLFPAEKIKVIYNGLKLEEYLSIGHKRLYSAAPGEIIIGHAGRMVYQKGHEYLIDIAARLKAENINFTLLLAGKGPLEESVRDKVKKLGLEDEVVFLGFVEDMVSFMQTIDIFVLTSRWEGFGFVLAEAMIHKKPVVAFDISSNPELIEHGKNGFLVKPFNVDDFSNYLVTLIKNPSLQTSFGNYGFEKVKEQFTFERAQKDLLEMLGS
jgi:glycosyltransferase involved in cell wall biosynthesis